MVWWVPYLKRLKPESNNGPEMTSIEATVWTPLHLFETDLYNGPSLSHGVYLCSSLLLMVSWQVPHLSTGSTPDFNNDLGADSNSGPILGPRRLFKSNLNNDPSLGHSNLVSNEVYICSGIHLFKKITKRSRLFCCR